jgi:hypothetical protein
MNKRNIIVIFHEKMERNNTDSVGGKLSSRHNYHYSIGGNWFYDSSSPNKVFSQLEFV